MRPSKRIWDQVRARDERCVACNRPDLATFQHRQAVGMGGSKHRVGVTEGILLCSFCNEAVEHTMRDRALVYGWKVPARSAWPLLDPAKVPVWYPYRRTWAYLASDGDIVRIDRAEAINTMRNTYGPLWDEWVSRLPYLGVAG
jgi:hypothetical protein